MVIKEKNRSYMGFWLRDLVFTWPLLLYTKLIWNSY